MIKNTRKGFTLIEILIVVAIIAILASVVLVGLGPTQQAGRDARRISDLSEIQNGLELYYNAKGQYPAPAAGTWSAGLDYRSYRSKHRCFYRAERSQLESELPVLVFGRADGVCSWSATREC